MDSEITEGSGLLSQIQHNNTYNTNDKLTLKDFKRFMKDLEFKDTFQPRDNKGRFISGPRYYKASQRQYVMYTGTTGVFMFDLEMRGIDLPTGIKHSCVTFKKIPNILYINIGRKEGANKVIINMNDKIYSSYKGTVKLGSYNTIGKAIKQFKL